VRSLVSNSIYAKKNRNGLLVPTKLLLRTSPDVAMLFAPFGHKDLAGSYIMKLKGS